MCEYKKRIKINERARDTSVRSKKKRQESTQQIADSRNDLL